MKTNKISKTTFVALVFIFAWQAYAQVTLELKDGKKIKIDEETLTRLRKNSEIIKTMYEDVEGKADEVVFIPLVSDNEFNELDSYFKLAEESPTKLDQKINTLNDLSMLVILVQNANYLDSPLLVEKFSNRIADILTTNTELQASFLQNGSIQELENITDSYMRSKIAKQIFEKNPEIQVNLIEQFRHVIKLPSDVYKNEILFRSAAFSPDGTKVITVSRIGNTRIWDANNGKLLLGLEFGSGNMDEHGHTANVSSAVFSPDESKIVTASQDNTSKIWNANNGTLLFTLAGDNGHIGSVFSAVFSPDGSKVVTTSEDKTAKIWDANNGTLLFTLAGDNGHTDLIVSAVFSPDGSKVVTASEDKTSKIWDVNNGALLFTLAGDNGHTEWIKSATFSSDGSKIITASMDKTAKIWNTDNGELLITLPDTSAIYSAAFSPDGSEVVTTSGDKTVKIWDSVNGKLLITFANNRLASSVAFSSDGTKILTREFSGTANILNIKNDLAAKDYFENKLQTIEQALFLYLLNQSNDKQALLKNEKLQPIINSFPQEISDALRAMI